MSEQPLEVLIGSRAADHVLISVVGRAYPAAEDDADGDWLITPIQLRAGRFSGDLPRASLRSSELRSFLEGLASLDETLEGEAVLESIEGWITLVVRGDRRGGVSISGAATDRSETGGHLSFEMGLDQSYLPPILDALRAVEIAHPTPSRSRR